MYIRTLFPEIKAAVDIYLGMFKLVVEGQAASLKCNLNVCAIRVSGHLQFDNCLI